MDVCGSRANYKDALESARGYPYKAQDPNNLRAAKPLAM
jgi:hypothetical protein